MTTLAEKIAVMQAYERGEEIEFRRPSYKENDWKKAASPVWDWSVCDYRVAAKNQLIALQCDCTLVLKPDQRYAGTIWLPVRKPYAVVLLPGEIEDVGWEKAGKWAAAQGGELPDRLEGALLCATLKAEFKPEQYWLDEQHVSNSNYAWYQGFDHGVQCYYHKSDQLRARAIKRIHL